jgi:hypothetical protein
MNWLRTSAVGLLLALPLAVAHAQFAGRLVDAIDVTERRGRIDISLIFGCPMRYLNHTPGSEGQTVRVRLLALPECGNVAGALLAPPVADTRVIRRIDFDQLANNEVTLSLDFTRSEQFVLAPAGDNRGLRIRLLRPDADGAQVFIGESPASPAVYAVNLESSQEPFAQDALEAARSATSAPVYVSEYQLGDQKWYRLRAGPFATEADARKVLVAARSSYPKAWLAIGDDETVNAPGSADAKPPALPTLPRANASMTQQDIEATFAKAKKAFARKDYETAIPLLTKLLEQPEFSRRADAQELMGLARERNRQLAHAKAEYEEYLRRYPDSRGVKRVKQRLHALALATRPSKTGTGFAEEESAWRFYGGASQIYRRDSFDFETPTLSTSLTTQEALLNDVDLVARRRGERFDFAARASAGFIKDLLPEGPGDQTHVATAFVEFGDREIDWAARLGRQTRNTGGLFGTFDGLSAGYQIAPSVRLNAVVGFPVENTRDGLETAREFYALAADLGTFAEAWDFSVYGVSQQLEGEVDRRAVGTEVRYFKPGRTLVALADYDVHFQQLNNTLLVATVELPARWTLSANLDRRRSPSLSLRNALIGQPVSTIEELLVLFPLREAEQFALDRTADSELYSLSISRPFGERWQWILDASRFDIGGTPASGGVDEVPDLGAEDAVSLQGIASSLFGGSDLSSFLLRYQTSDTTEISTLGFSTRFSIGGDWRLGPRLRVDQRRFLIDESDQLLYTPTVRLELLKRHVLFECEAGAEIGRRELLTSEEKTTRFYFSLGYRMNF